MAKGVAGGRGPSPGSASPAEINMALTRKNQRPSPSNPYGGPIGTTFDAGNSMLTANNAAVPNPVAAQQAAVPNPALAQQANTVAYNPQLAPSQPVDAATAAAMQQQQQPPQYDAATLAALQQQQAAAAPQYNVNAASVNNAATDWTTAAAGIDPSVNDQSAYYDQTGAGTYDAYQTGVTTPTSKNALASKATLSGNGQGGNDHVCFSCSTA